MSNQEILQKYLNECKINVVVDQSTIVVTGDATVPSTRLDKLKNGIDHYVNTKYPSEYQDKEDYKDCKVYSGESYVAITDKKNHVIVFVPIYELHRVEKRGNIISMTGHETTATVVLNDLMNSFSYHTR